MSSAAPVEWKGPASNKQFMGHPVGLFVLFFALFPQPLSALAEAAAASLF